MTITQYKLMIMLLFRNPFTLQSNSNNVCLSPSFHPKPTLNGNHKDSFKHWTLLTFYQTTANWRRGRGPEHLILRATNLQADQNLKTCGHGWKDGLSPLNSSFENLGSRHSAGQKMERYTESYLDSEGLEWPLLP